VALEANQSTLERAQRLAVALQALSLAHDRRNNVSVIADEMEARRLLLPSKSLLDLATVIRVLDEDIRKARILYEFLLDPAVSVPEPDPGKRISLGLEKTDHLGMQGEPEQTRQKHN